MLTKDQESILPFIGHMAIYSCLSNEAISRNLYPQLKILSYSNSELRSN